MCYAGRPRKKCVRRTAAATTGGSEQAKWRLDFMAMSRSSSWKEHRLANRLSCDGTEYNVDLVARKATGVEGWKMTLVFMPRDEGAEVKVELPNAASTADVRKSVRDLEGASERLCELFREGERGE